MFYPYEGYRSVTPLDAARVNRTIFLNHLCCTSARFLLRKKLFGKRVRWARVLRRYLCEPRLHYGTEGYFFRNTEKRYPYVTKAAAQQQHSSSSAAAQQQLSSSTAEAAAAAVVAAAASKAA